MDGARMMEGCASSCDIKVSAIGSSDRLSSHHWRDALQWGLAWAETAATAGSESHRLSIGSELEPGRDHWRQRSLASMRTLNCIHVAAQLAMEEIQAWPAHPHRVVATIAVVLFQPSLMINHGCFVSGEDTVVFPA